MMLVQSNLKQIMHAVLASVVFACWSAGAMSQSSSTITEARVIESEPVYQTVQITTPTQECWQEPVRVESSNYSSTPAILGAIIGGSVGNEFGSGRGKDVATVAGAVLGGSIGHDIEKNSQRGDGRTVYEQRCRTVSNVSTEERFQGYDVTYEYDGQLFKARTKNHPGQTIRVRVSVLPVE
ncbi:MAG: glycine zipper 2TM domain-containing protein [Gammaproteobacteria bacterium]|nr:glycine zipper 2TM domain-containing protein [Gammaproteobacteria bacterium]